MPFSTGFARRGLAGSGFAVLLLLSGVRATESGPAGAAAVPPGPARLVHDFFPGRFDDSPLLPQLTRLGGVLFFVASDRDTGTNVWRTDGTPAGTRRVPFAETAGSVAGSGIVGALNGRMLLAAGVGGDSGLAALFAAGEQGEATFLHAFRPNLDSAQTAQPIVGGRFYFQDCGEVRCEVWSTDGTPAGTAPVAVLSGPTADVHQDLLGTFADRWLLAAEGSSLVAYDGVTQRVLTLADRADAALYPVGGSLFLLRGDGLYVSTLAAPRARLLFRAPGLASAGWHGDTFFFVPPNGRLWSTDGETVSRYTGGYFESFSVVAGRLGAIGGKTILPMPGYYGQALFGVDEASHQVSDIHWVCRGKYQCLVPRLSGVTFVGDQAFLAIDKRLWHSDGTPQGTRPLQPIVLPDPSSFKALDGRLILGAQSRRDDRRFLERQLWTTDGTAAGTAMLSGGGRPFSVQGPAEPLGEALITAADRPPVGQQLWRIADGRTTPLTALRHQATGINPQVAFPLGGGRLVLGGSLGWTGVTPEGVTDTLRPEIDFCSADASPCLDVPVAVGGRLIFQEAGTALLKSTDGTFAGRRGLPLEDADGVGSVVASLGTFRDRAMILGNSGGLWTSDGTTTGTRFVTRLPPEPVTGSSGLPVVAPFADGAASYLFRRVPDPDDDKLAALELWRTDGTPAGTERLAAIPFDQEATPYPNPVLVGGKLFFRVLGALWGSDGTAAGTRALAAQPPGGTFALAAGDTVLYAGAGYQSTEVPTPPQTLWAIDPTTLAAAKIATFPTVGAGFPGVPLGSLVEDTLFFEARNPGGVQRGWRTEGTAASTVRLPDFLATAGQGFVTAGDHRYFTACEGAHGCELWSTDRLGEDTRLVEDLFPGTRGSDPEILAVAGHTLWFAGTEPDVGRELWTLEVPAGTAGPTKAAWVRPATPSARRAREPLWKRRLR
jgi:ELWxxDGT repeat protein